MLLWSAFAGAAAATAPVILVWGDSLSAAHGIPLESGWVQLLQARLREQAYPHRVVNGSVSGETTAGGLARLPAALAEFHPRIVLIELGGNDGLRGLPLKQMRANLRAMVARSRAAGAQVLVFEMQIPPNYGPEYLEGFRKSFAEVARAGHARLVPFFLAPIVGDIGRWFQDDGIHPNVAAQPLLLDAIWPALQPAVAGKAAKRTAPAA